MRVEYGKTERLRFLSHLEIVRACERSVRRAGLAYAVTQGFNPRMKVGFGPALPVGSAGLREYFDVWLTSYVPTEEVRDRLIRSTPRDMAPRGVSYVAAAEPSLSAALTIARYGVDVAAEGVSGGSLDEAVQAVVADGELSVQHKGKQKVFDLGRCLPEEPQVEKAAPGVERVLLTVRMGEEGSLRPESLVGEALSRVGVGNAAMQVTRTDLLIDDGGVWRRPS